MLTVRYAVDFNIVGDNISDIASEDTGSLTGWRLRFYCGDHP